MEGNVINASTFAPILDAKVDIIGELPLERTDVSGDYATGLATAGTYQVEVKKHGFETATTTVNLSNGNVTVQDFALVPEASFTFSGNVIDKDSGNPIEDAQVFISTDGYEETFATDANGDFILNPFYSSTYQIWVGKWGYKTVLVDQIEINENNNQTTVELEKGIEDVFALDLGWSVDGSASFSQGAFELADPLDVSFDSPFGPIVFQTGDDVPDDLGDLGNGCYVTGNVADFQAGWLQSDLTKITSPKFDLTTMNEPMMSYYTWFFNAVANPQNPMAGNDKIVVRVSNGNEIVTVDEIEFTNLFAPVEWTLSEINLKDTITATDNMRVIFEVNETGFDDFSEALVDYFQVWDANPTGVNHIDNESFTLNAQPNPSSSEFNIYYELKIQNENTQMVVFNTLGQQIQAFDLSDLNGRIELGSDFDKGVYFVQIQQEGKLNKALKLIKQ